MPARNYIVNGEDVMYPIPWQVAILDTSGEVRLQNFLLISIFTCFVIYQIYSIKLGECFIYLNFTNLKLIYLNFYLDLNHKAFCSGTIVNKFYVITAAVSLKILINIV